MSLESLHRSLRDEVRQNSRSGRIVVAVDALDAEAATAFAEGFAAALGADGTPVFRASLGEVAPDRAEAVRAELVAPFRAGEPFPPVGVEAAPADAVLVVDGAFLLDSALRGMWHWSVWLESSPPIGAPAPERSDAQKHYLAATRPRATASAIVENSNPADPVRVFGDFC
ncbi:hypothetical protein [Microbacterium sp. 5K110]|jgi:hypothetical protein|uniref:hypothetical protein n=1 Tax=unclassified Microbacterium TaxID=2609290 RepID=UPI0010FDA046|nr:hypothetical protein [Microbacterium sp. 5K110]TLF26995.1 hypothetical protein FE256_16235 [Microbacterium sp. 5K110]